MRKGAELEPLFRLSTTASMGESEAGKKILRQELIEIWIEIWSGSL